MKKEPNYQKTFEGLKAAMEETLLAAFAHRIIDGENPIRVYRNMRGISQAKLAKMANISTSYLSEIESNKKDGSIKTIKRIANALDVKIDDLILDD